MLTHKQNLNELNMKKDKDLQLRSHDNIQWQWKRNAGKDSHSKRADRV